MSRVEKRSQDWNNLVLIKWILFKSDTRLMPNTILLCFTAVLFVGSFIAPTTLDASASLSKKTLPRQQEPFGRFEVTSHVNVTVTGKRRSRLLGGEY
eukprot:2771223-Amphidinium_carterae.1